MLILCYKSNKNVSFKKLTQLLDQFVGHSLLFQMCEYKILREEYSKYPQMLLQ